MCLGSWKDPFFVPLRRFPQRINMFHLGMLLSAEKPRDGFQLGVVLEKTSGMWSSPRTNPNIRCKTLKRFYQGTLFLLFFHSIFVHLKHMVRMLPNICSPRRDCREAPNSEMTLQVLSHRAGNLQRNANSYNFLCCVGNLKRKWAGIPAQDSNLCNQEKNLHCSKTADWNDLVT